MGKEVLCKKPAFKNKKKKVQKLDSKQNGLPAEQENLACLDFLSVKISDLSEPTDILKLLYSHKKQVHFS